MTRVGQILVIAITCLSLLFMGFAISVFSTKKNWKDLYQAEVDKLKKADDQKKSLQAQIDILTTTITREVEKHKTDREAWAIQIRDQLRDYVDLSDRYKAAVQERQASETQMQQAIQEATDRRVEALRLRKLLDETQTAKEEAVRKQFDTEQRHIELQSQHEITSARLREMEQRAAELAAVLEGYGLPTESKEAREKAIANPPQVEGIVLKVDPQGKFIEISIGSDAGLRRGHKLEVYHVDPKGEYVGRIELTQVDPDRAVARIIPQFKQRAFQKGDIVSHESLLRGRIAGK